MHDSDLEKLKYPIGKFQPLQDLNSACIKKHIYEIAMLPERLEEAVAGLSNDQLDTAYREGGWTLRQVVHHVADSHVNSYVRFRWALTEEEPVIKAYDQDGWANLSDAKNGSLDLSLPVIRALHSRWVHLLNELDETALQRSFVHPETGKKTSLARNITMYSWHGNHHVAQITGLRATKGW